MVNALVASTQVVCVSEAAMYSMSGLYSLHEAINVMQKNYNPSLTIAGVVINNFRKQTTRSKEWENAIKQYEQKAGTDVIGIVPERIVISEATTQNRGLDDYDGTKEIGAIYDEIAQKLIRGEKHD
jgi:chromosome partitioning protein